MKTFRVYFAAGGFINIKAKSVGKIMDDMVILHDEAGSVVGCFTVALIIGVVEVSQLTD